MVKEVRVKTVLNKHKKRDDWFLDDYSLNPYKLCDFGCVYCYIRGSKYGEHMGSELAAKINAPAVLEKELLKYAKRKMCGFIAVSSSTEPWMYVEQRYMLTRKCLQVISRFKFPVRCLTKSKLILRDLDLLHEIDKNAVLPEDLKGKLGRGVLITFSLSTLDDKLAEKFEPNAPKPSERLEVLKKVREEGFCAGIAFMPILPFLSDTREQLEEMVKTVKECDANYVFFSELTLYGAGKELYYKVLSNHFPELLPKYKALFGSSFRPKKLYRDRFYKLARKLCEKYGVKHGII